MSKPTYEELEQALRDIEQYSRDLRTCRTDGVWDLTTPVEQIGIRARTALGMDGAFVAPADDYAA